MKSLLICFALGAASFASAQKTNDTLLIKQLLEKESATWRAGDVEGHADCWMIRPYSKILVSTPSGCYDVPPQSMVHPADGMMGKGGTSRNTNYLFHVHGNEAWVSHDEESTAKDGTITNSHEIRMLEKINRQWKLVGQSIHIYKKL